MNTPKPNTFFQDGDRIYDSQEKYFAEIKLATDVKLKGRKPCRLFHEIKGYLCQGNQWDHDITKAITFDSKKQCNNWLTAYFTPADTDKTDSIFNHFTVASNETIESSNDEETPPAVDDITQVILNALPTLGGIDPTQIINPTSKSMETTTTKETVKPAYSEYTEKVVKEFETSGIPRDVTLCCVEIFTPENSQKLAKKFIGDYLKEDGTLKDQCDYLKPFFGGGWMAINSTLDGKINPATTSKLFNTRRRFDEAKNEYEDVKYEMPFGLKTTKDVHWYLLPTFTDKEVLKRLLDGIIKKHNLPLKAENYNSYARFFYHAKAYISPQVSEGYKKAVKLICDGELGFSFFSVTIWGYKENDQTVTDSDGIKKLHPQIKELLDPCEDLIICFDSDQKVKTKKNVQNQCEQIAVACYKELGIDVKRRVWDYKLGKGIDDLLAKGNSLESNTDLVDFDIERLIQTIIEKRTKAKSEIPPLPSQDVMANMIRETYPNIAYVSEYKTFFKYGAKREGIWEVIDPQIVAKNIDDYLQENKFVGYTESFIQGVVGLLKLRTMVTDWTEAPNLIPFIDGVLDINTNQFINHKPENYVTWCLPRHYNIRNSISQKWTEIDNWLNEATNNDLRDKNLLLCFAAATLRQRYDLQKFLHLHGRGGSGKGTFTNLLTDLIGSENTASLNFDQLTEKDAMADIFTSKLVVFSDQETLKKDAQTIFKKITGCDKVRGRKLFKDGFYFRYQGMCVVTSNGPIFTGGTETWLTRRTLAIPFQTIVEKPVNLSKKFEPELSAFTHYLLSIPIETIEATLTENHGVITKNLWDVQTFSDALAGWVNDHIIFDQEAKSLIGIDGKEWVNYAEYNPIQSTLFGSYCLYCTSTNRKGLLTKDNFSKQLLEILSQLKQQCDKKRTNKGFAISGIRLRTESDHHIPTIEDLLRQHQEDQAQIISSADKRADLKPLPDKEMQTSVHTVHTSADPSADLKTLPDKESADRAGLKGISNDSDKENISQGKKQEVIKALEKAHSEGHKQINHANLTIKYLPKTYKPLDAFNVLMELVSDGVCDYQAGELFQLIDYKPVESSPPKQATTDLGQEIIKALNHATNNGRVYIDYMELEMTYLDHLDVKSPEVLTRLKQLEADGMVKTDPLNEKAFRLVSKKS